MAEFQSILTPKSKPFERAVEQAAALQILAIDPDALKRMRDPYQCGVSHLPFLAWGKGVDLWRDNWPEWKKRRITAEIYQMKGLKGTLPGINKYLSYLDAKIYDAIIPPVGVYAVDYAAGNLEAWKAQFPELRLYPFTIPGRRPAFVAGSGVNLSPAFAGWGFALPNEAARYYGRRAALVENGVEREIKSIDQLGTWGSDAAVGTVTFGIPAAGTIADTTADHSFVGYSYAVAKNRSRMITIGRDGTFGAGGIPSGIDSVTPLSISPERVYRRHAARYFEAFAVREGKSGAGWAFAYSDEAAENIFDRWRLMDAEKQKIQTIGMMASFVGHSYVGLSPYTALLRVDASYQLDGWWCFAGQSFVGKTFVSAGTDRINDVGEAIYKSRALRDQVWFSTSTHRPMKISDLNFNTPQPWAGMKPIERVLI